MKINFRVSPEETGERLDKFLAVHLPQYSRSFLVEEIKTGKIRVDGAIAKASHKLKEGLTISGEIGEPRTFEVKPDESVLVNVVREDKNFLVIDKSAGLVVHPSASYPEKTLVNGLLARYPEIKNVGDFEAGEENFRPGIVHRLDKETSGLMVVARDQKTFQFLKEQFQKRSVGKKYIVLVQGTMPRRDRGTIDLPIRRSLGGGKQVAEKKGAGSASARPALTEFRIIKRYKNKTLLEVCPKTGRMHQIRVHFAAIGHPVVGDKLYGVKSGKIPKLFMPRHFLHASELSFLAMDGRKIEINSPLPPDLADFLAGLVPLEV